MYDERLTLAEAGLKILKYDNRSILKWLKKHQVVYGKDGRSYYVYGESLNDALNKIKKADFERNNQIPFKLIQSKPEKNKIENVITNKLMNKLYGN
jgi:phage antirepressor YoqD-like protein